MKMGENQKEDERTHLLVETNGSSYVSLPGHPGHSDSDEAFLERPINPTIGRSRSITGVRPSVEQRRSSNAIIIHNRSQSSCYLANV